MALPDNACLPYDRGYDRIYAMIKKIILSGKNLFDNSTAGICGRAGLAVVILLVVFLARSLFLPGEIRPYPLDLSSYPALTVKSSEQLIGLLKENNLWDIAPDSPINPMIIKTFPSDIRDLTVKTRKRIFLHTLLPAVLLVEAEINWEKRAVRQARQRLGRDWYASGCSFDSRGWQKNFSAAEVEFITGLAEKYRTDNCEELYLRIDTLPVSLILAQGALESFWGSSRFALEGNSLFGIWTWGTNGIIPQRRDPDKNHRVAHYSSLLDSVRAYLLNLNRMEAYEKLRQLRQKSDDSIVLSAGLLYYSTRRQDYIKDIILVIEHNNLKKYDNYVLKKVL